MMPLMLAGIGEENTIKKIGGSPEIKKHLEDLGFVVGGSVTIVNALGGNVIGKTATFCGPQIFAVCKRRCCECE